MNEQGVLAKVIKKEELHPVEYLKLRFENKSTIWIRYEDGLDVQIDDVFFISNERMVKVEKEMWNEVTEPEDVNVSQFRYDPENVKDTFQDYGGNKEVVERAKELIKISLEKKESLRNIGTKPIKGVLFTGPPGTGKTMLARIIAKDVMANLYHINGPEIYTKYMGDSEKILREIFKEAQTKEKAIIFFDEIDSIASRRQDESHEMSKRVVTQLLTLMDGFNPDNNTLVIGTTNRPDDIDPALRRPGRFDWEINFSPPRSIEEIIQILRASGREIEKSNDISYYHIASNLNGWSPSEISGLWNEAGIIAVMDDREKIYTEDLEGAIYRISMRK